MIISGGTFSGYVAAQVPESAAKTFSDDAVRQMFASAVVRQGVPVEEQLGLLPFRITELGGFRKIRTLPPGGAVVLWVGPTAEPEPVRRVAGQLAADVESAAGGLIVLRKTGTTPEGFPRRPGMAKKRPLA